MAAAEVGENAVCCFIFIGSDDVHREFLVGSAVAERTASSVGLHGAADPRSRYKHHERWSPGKPAPALYRRSASEVSLKVQEWTVSDTL